MLRILQGYQLQDYLRSEFANRKAGIHNAPNWRPLQIYNAYSDNRELDYFFVAKIDREKRIIDTYVLPLTLIKYEYGQYRMDLTEHYGGTLENGIYYYEFNNGIDTFFSEIFMISNFGFIPKASDMILASSDNYVSDSGIELPALQPIQRLEDSDYLLEEA